MATHLPYEPLAVLIGVVLAALWLDLRLYRPASGVATAAAWSAAWAIAALAFCGYLLARFGAHPARAFLVAYLLERALSVDNLLVFVAIFASFRLGSALQQRVLLFGVLGALALRLLLVACGLGLFGMGAGIDLLFAPMLAWSASTLLRDDAAPGVTNDYSQHWSVRLARRLLPVSPRLHGSRFLVSHRRYRSLPTHDTAPEVEAPAARVHVTPLLLCLICVNAADLMFSLDSVPAVLAVTRDPLPAYSAITFSALGLRSLYGLLAALTGHCARLQRAVAILLFGIAAKLALEGMHALFGWPGITIGPGASLAGVTLILAGGVLAEWRAVRRASRPAPALPLRHSTPGSASALSPLRPHPPGHIPGSQHDADPLPPHRGH